MIKNKHHAKLWKKAKKSPEAVVHAICSESPRHEDEFTGMITELKEQDIIIKCSSWHQGMKDQNPIDFVRFVDKAAPPFGMSGDPGNQMAKQIGGEDYRMFITRDFQKNVIRAYCRDPAKKNLLSHAFESYWERVTKGFANNTIAPPPVNFAIDVDEPASDTSCDYSNDESSRVLAQLTQDSCDDGEEYTPVKSFQRGDRNLTSPSPILRRWP